MNSSSSHELLGRNYSTPEYHNLVVGVDDKLPPNHKITYIPFTAEQQITGVHNMNYADSSHTAEIVRTADVIICVSRDEDPNPNYSDAHPDRNIVLTPSGQSNVDKSVELFDAARKAGNKDVRFVATGRMHNHAIRSMLALPVVADFIGIRAEDVYHIPEEQFEKRLRESFTTDNIHNLDLDVTSDHTEGEDEQVLASRKALVSTLEDEEHQALPPSEPTQHDLDKAAEAILAEYKKYPRISTSRLMVERAAKSGVPLEAILEEDGAVDTITNLLNTLEMLQDAEDAKDIDLRRIVVVAGSDHLPRTAWLLDHIMPDGIEIICVESDPALDDEAYAASCARELSSFNKGSKWIGGTRDLAELNNIAEPAYFGTARVNTRELEATIKAAASTAATAGHITVKNTTLS